MSGAPVGRRGFDKQYNGYWVIPVRRSPGAGNAGGFTSLTSIRLSAVPLINRRYWESPSLTYANAKASCARLGHMEDLKVRSQCRLPPKLGGIVRRHSILVDLSLGNRWSTVRTRWSGAIILVVYMTGACKSHAIGMARSGFN